jgi:hypothetical protein
MARVATVLLLLATGSFLVALARPTLRTTGQSFLQARSRWGSSTKPKGEEDEPPEQLPPEAVKESLETSSKDTGVPYCTLCITLLERKRAETNEGFLCRGMDQWASKKGVSRCTVGWLRCCALCACVSVLCFTRCSAVRGGAPGGVLVDG